MLNTVRYILISMRPAQWVKNLLIFAGLIFSRNLFNALAFWKVVGGFACFCLAASSIYLFNDIKDIENDREHPDKRKRPLASSDLKVDRAYYAMVLNGLIAVTGSFMLDSIFFAIVMAYITINA